jgi:CheY-like chemotaxis protein/anti-sigma regulatory factor (Ser/Thr protein kinase)
VLAHELRNPLAPIRNAVQVMANAPPDDPVHALMRQTIDRQSAQLTRIVDDMLDIARITRNQIVMADAALDLNEVVHRAVETSTLALQPGKQRLELDLPATPVQVRGDVHRLTQVVSNLLINAARYTPADGRVTVQTRAIDGRAELRVVDTGCGIAPDMLERVFDMFVRGDTARHRGGAGLGVGLALARRIAEMHGGTLQAYSAGENRGSEFTLCLPLATYVTAAAAAETEPAMRSTTTVRANPAGRRILVADDNVDAALTLAQVLKSLGHVTSVVHDGADAISAAIDFRPDVVLLDIGMPGLDGYEVARRLRASGANDLMRIIAVTGWGQESDRKKSEAAGFDVHLVKPVDVTELVRAVAAPGETVH